MTVSRTHPHADQETIVLAYYDALTEGRLYALDTLFADDFVEHELVPGLSPTVSGLQQKYAMLRSGFSDLRFTPEDTLPHANRVAVRVTVSGTHDGVFMGQPPTGRTFAVTAVGIFRIERGRIAEHWGVFDQLAMLAQLDAMGSRAARGTVDPPRAGAD
jgi:steroid delta-isomerase-like uncharacterized protein